MPLQAVFPALLDRIVDSKLVVQEGKKNKVTDVRLQEADGLRRGAGDPGLLAPARDRPPVTAEKLQQRYEERLKSMPPEEEVHARHILVATEDEAKALIAEIKKGAAFDKLAKDKSTDKASGAEGGDLGWFKRTDMVKEFADAAFELKKGELTERRSRPSSATTSSRSKTAARRRRRRSRSWPNSSARSWPARR